MSKIDLHIHSNYSDDGEYSPEEILLQCKAQGMELIAITDHNSVKGIPGALDGSDNLKVITGVELDCTYEGRNFHLLGYGFDPSKGGYGEIEQNIIRQEINAAEEKVERFRTATGIPLKTGNVLAASDNGIITGELIGEIVLAMPDAAGYDLLQPYLPGGIKSDMPYVAFYWDFFSEGRPAYVPIHYPSLRECIALIHETGGSAVLAHPGQNLKNDATLLPGIISEGIDGIEAFSSYHSRAVSEYYLDAAKQHHLFVTCGSDFHGRNKPNIRLGAHGACWQDSLLHSELDFISGLR